MKLSFPKLNQVILILIISEFLLVVAAGIILPVFAVFVLEDIAGATLKVIGFATAIYWLTKSVLQLPIARRLDKNHGEIDDYYSMVFGVFVVISAVFLYYFATKVWHVYALQFLIAIGDAFAVPPFYAIFTRHIDPNSEGFEWSLRSSFSFGAGSAISGALSGVLATAIGIRALFLVNGTMMLMGVIVLLFLKPYIKPRTPTPVERVFIEQKRV